MKNDKTISQKILEAHKKTQIPRSSPTYSVLKNVQNITCIFDLLALAEYRFSLRKLQIIIKENIYYSSIQFLLIFFTKDIFH